LVAFFVAFLVAFFAVFFAAFFVAFLVAFLVAIVNSDSLFQTIWYCFVLLYRDFHIFRQQKVDKHRSMDYHGRARHTFE
jgi:hypothetical protein